MAEDTQKSDEQQPAPVPQQPVDAAYVGVKGWLLFLCVVMTILSPLASLSRMMTGCESARQASHISGVNTLVTIDTIFSLVLIALSFYAGVGLWSKRSGAVKTAFTFFKTYLGYLAWCLFSPVLLPSRYQAAYFGAILPLVIGGLIGYWIWTSYLKKSKRVKATYAD
ncbi:DUF2569 family protein [Candidatus Woesearchaeota archaeon]|nr:DUF2569 family protein [Candidatus Woesearchaeota archaeon]